MILYLSSSLTEMIEAKNDAAEEATLRKSFFRSSDALHGAMVILPLCPLLADPSIQPQEIAVVRFFCRKSASTHAAVAFWLLILGARHDLFTKNISSTLWCCYIAQHVFTDTHTGPLVHCLWCSIAAEDPRRAG